MSMAYKTKWCTVCGEEKGLWDFYEHKYTKDGRQCQCKACHSLYHKKRYRDKQLAKESLKKDNDLG